MREGADERTHTTQCQREQVSVVEMIQETLSVTKLVQKHEIYIEEIHKNLKTFRTDHEELRATVESLKSPLEKVAKDIDEIKITTSSLIPLVPLVTRYNFIKHWATIVSYAVTAGVFIYLLFGSNGIKLYKMYLEL